MQLKIPHKFSKDEAVAKVKKALDEARPQLSQHGATIEEEKWDGDTLNFAFSAQGQSVSGTLEVKDKEFDLYAKLPMMLKFFEGKIEKMITERATQMLG